jgi:hypothetical protein
MTMPGEPLTAVVVEIDRLRRARKAQRGLPRALSMTGTAPEWLVRTFIELDAEGAPTVVALVTSASPAVKACFGVEGERIRVVVRAVGTQAMGRAP